MADLADGSRSSPPVTRGKLACAACGALITATRHRRAVQGKRRHDLRNPAGIAFRVGCFREAIGCLVVGPDSVEASWFSGFAWRRAFCAGCRAHLGWCFRGRNDSRFFALILDRLRG